MDTLNGLLNGIVSDPKEETRWLVLADWLEENDDPRRGELLRLHRRLLASWRHPESDPQRAAYHARMVELLEQGVRPCIPQETLRVAGGVEMTFSFIPPATFPMGRAGGAYCEVPVHLVTLTRGFYLGVYQVTQQQWEAVMGENPAIFKGPNRPVEQVTWEECQTFCGEVSKRTGRAVSLPTSAQWECGCRAGTTTEFHTGEGGAALQKAGWHYDNGSPYPNRETQPVGQLTPNAWGLFDTHGNLWELCLDWSGAYDVGHKIDPTGPESGTRRVMRGGCMGNAAQYCGSAYRDDYDQKTNGSGIGFRVALAPADV